MSKWMDKLFKEDNNKLLQTLQAKLSEVFGRLCVSTFYLLSLSFIPPTLSFTLLPSVSFPPYRSISVSDNLSLSLSPSSLYPCLSLLLSFWLGASTRLIFVFPLCLKISATKKEKKIFFIKSKGKGKEESKSKKLKEREKDDENAQEKNVDSGGREVACPEPILPSSSLG
tara:strand:- start:836 stop:1345 length:510 start_codon:yes stop_codon:yes gene_type:complete